MLRIGIWLSADTSGWNVRKYASMRSWSPLLNASSHALKVWPAECQESRPAPLRAQPPRPEGNAVGRTSALQQDCLDFYGSILRSRRRLLRFIRGFTPTSIHEAWASPERSTFPGRNRPAIWTVDFQLSTLDFSASDIL